MGSARATSGASSGASGVYCDVSCVLRDAFEPRGLLAREGGPTSRGHRRDAGDDDDLRREGDDTRRDGDNCLIPRTSPRRDLRRVKSVDKPSPTMLLPRRLDLILRHTTHHAASSILNRRSYARLFYDVYGALWTSGMRWETHQRARRARSRGRLGDGDADERNTGILSRRVSAARAIYATIRTPSDRRPRHSRGLPLAFAPLGFAI